MAAARSLWVSQRLSRGTHNMPLLCLKHGSGPGRGKERSCKLSPKLNTTHLLSNFAVTPCFLRSLSRLNSSFPLQTKEKNQQSIALSRPKLSSHLDSAAARYPCCFSVRRMDQSGDTTVTVGSRFRRRQAFSSCSRSSLHTSFLTWAAEV